MWQWFRDIFDAVKTVAQGMGVTLRYWLKTYDPDARRSRSTLSILSCPCPSLRATGVFIVTI